MPTTEVISLAELWERCARANSSFNEFHVDASGGFTIIIHVRYQEGTEPHLVSFLLPSYHKADVTYVVLDVLRVSPANKFWPPDLLEPIFHPEEDA